MLLGLVRTLISKLREAKPGRRATVDEVWKEVNVTSSCRGAKKRVHGRRSWVQALDIWLKSFI